MLIETISNIRKNYSSDPRDIKQIQTAAEMLLHDLEITDKQYPFPVVSVLKKMGFQLLRGSFKDPFQSGLIAVDSSLPEQNPAFTADRIVLVNKNDSVAHQRFTIAHEIAHYIFDYDERTQPIYYKSYLTTETESDVEWRANRFAAELLMPTKHFRDEYNKFAKEQGELFSLPATITYLCKMFDVPAKAVQLRFDEVGCQIPTNEVNEV